MVTAPDRVLLTGSRSIRARPGDEKSNTQSIAWPGPAMKPSSDIDLFTTTVPFPVPVVRTVLLQKAFAGRHPGLRVMTLPAPESHRLASDKPTADDGDDREARPDG
jgi:hypothetical protein